MDDEASLLDLMKTLADKLDKQTKKTDPQDGLTCNSEQTINFSTSSAEASCKNQESDSLEGLVMQVKHQISSSDWLEKNTAEKWAKENPELANDFMAAAHGKPGNMEKEFKIYPDNKDRHSEGL
ncbi:hypothetical protein CHS0354_012359 [Potamilus streckersoni]|uniref:Uncharacterized protein n=1 Tax=Potamilus streckersoni TaxID=2493646 RepID=A0AAE0VX20_9BIVA|nr:hypothetical protein CHS0354_012359 [Potamilus streckersoni]